MTAFPKPKKRPKNRSARKKRDGRYSKERLKVIGGMICFICAAPAEVHHVRTKANRSKDDFRTIPLCQMHHSAQGGWLSVHGTPKVFADLYGESGENILTLIDAKLIEAGLERLVKK